MLDAGIGGQLDEPFNKPQPKEIKFRPIVRKSQNDYIAFGSVNTSIEAQHATYKSTDVVVIGATTAYCRSSQEAIDLNKGELNHGQDAVSIVVAEGNHIISQADGVSQSYLGEFAAKTATTSIAENPSLDLSANLKVAIDAVRTVHLPEVNDGLPDLLKDALNATREQTGSETMLNIYSVDEQTGLVTGLFLGDGGFSILRKDGSARHYVTGKNADRLSTLKGQRGQTVSIEEIVGEKVILEEDDSLLIYSDALQHSSSKTKVKGRMVVDDICDSLKVNASRQVICEELNQAAKSDSNPDDITLVVYDQGKKSK